ncbi:hypothetical protein B0H16DRAFT_1308003 [Mycena metata]|uniref:Uncharacterized protein n=1 Tax=Mycena metata TaxID=1033252 RepID=A0AAD7JND1_9AGAR|nr:hypothetical protein B0H16DRAFT_1308003 [Mycena metata]
MALLRTTRSIVSGSAALLMVSDLEFEPGDLDIYSPLSQEESVMTIAEHRLGFLPTSSRTSVFYRSNDAILKVHRLVKSRKSMNVVVVNSENPAAAVFHFHSTVVMNYLSAFGLYCAYPSLTLKDLSVANLPVVLGEIGVRARAEECFDKYRSRGVTFETDVTRLPGHTVHVCRADPECPHTIRSTEDGRGLYKDLIPPTDAETAHFLRHLYSTIWMLGGPTCGATGVYFSNFVASIRAAEITVSSFQAKQSNTDAKTSTKEQIRIGIE